MGLRQPQRDALEILARVTVIAALEKQPDLTLAQEIIRSEYPSVQEFERDVPSLCCALAAGVGKTRLMGAFVAHLHGGERAGPSPEVGGDAHPRQMQQHVWTSEEEYEVKVSRYSLTGGVWSLHLMSRTPSQADRYLVYSPR